MARRKFKLNPDDLSDARSSLDRQSGNDQMMSKPLQKRKANSRRFQVGGNVKFRRTLEFKNAFAAIYGNIL